MCDIFVSMGMETALPSCISSFAKNDKNRDKGVFAEDLQHSCPKGHDYELYGYDLKLFCTLSLSVIRKVETNNWSRQAFRIQTKRL